MSIYFVDCRIRDTKQSGPPQCKEGAAPHAGSVVTFVLLGALPGTLGTNAIAVFVVEVHGPQRLESNNLTNCQV